MRIEYSMADKKKTIFINYDDYNLKELSVFHTYLLTAANKQL